MCFLHEQISFSAAQLAASSAVNVARREHTPPLESSADPNGHTDSVGQNYGGGMRDAQRDGACDGNETEMGGLRPKGEPEYFSIAAIVASKPGDIG